MSSKTDVRVLTIPGLGGSGARHWQSEWERKHPDYRRVLQRDWDAPHLSDWLVTLDAALKSSDRPALLVAHSLGCAVVAHWLAQAEHPERRVAGALLVAPPDLHAFGETLGSFAPFPALSVPLPLHVVVSRNDPHGNVDFARGLAAHWNAELIDVGEQGHINVDSGHGVWTEGEALLDALISSAARVRDPRGHQAE